MKIKDIRASLHGFSITIPERPGLGLTLNRDAWRATRVDAD